jgi:ABC-type transport system involved in cytochrome c biogenesis permease subunit
MFQEWWEKFLNNEHAQIIAVCAVVCFALSFIVALVTFLVRDKSSRDIRTFVLHIAIASIVSIVIMVFLTAVLIISFKLSEQYDPFAFLGG